MKLRLLKPLPGADVGTVSKPCSLNEDAHVIGNCSYDPLYLIAEGWADEVEERWEPKEGEPFYEINFDRNPHYPIVKRNGFSNHRFSRAHSAKFYGLATQTSEELETTLLLLKLRQSNGGWKPKHLEPYYCVIVGGYVRWANFRKEDSRHSTDALIGNCYRTSEEAEKYAPEWKKLFDSVK